MAVHGVALRKRPQPSIFTFYVVQVYLARWHEMIVAVKVLLKVGIALEDAEAAAEMAVSMSNPVMHNLQEVRQGGALPPIPCSSQHARWAALHLFGSRHWWPGVR